MRRRLSLDGMHAHEQRLRDLPVGAPGRRQLSNPFFGRRQVQRHGSHRPMRASSALARSAHKGARATPGLAA